MNDRIVRAILRGILAAAGSVVIASLIVVLTVMLLQPSPPPTFASAVHSFAHLFAIAALSSAPFVAVGLVVWALPVDYVLHRQGIRSPIAYVGCGAVAGLFVGALFGLPIGAGAGLFLLIGIALVYGVVTASVYWFLFPRARAREA